MRKRKIGTLACLILINSIDVKGSSSVVVVVAVADYLWAILCETATRIMAKQVVSCEGRAVLSILELEKKSFILYHIMTKTPSLPLCGGEYDQRQLLCSSYCSMEQSCTNSSVRKICLRFKLSVFYELQLRRPDSVTLSFFRIPVSWNTYYILSSFV